jgi:(E)-4-hydroxy-3-methylbut-2-enyl-diphosphate synthase
MVASALNQTRILEDENFRDIKISLKASDVPSTVEAYRLIAEKCDYPLHLGITEAGTAFTGAIRSAVGLGILLAEGIGDTVRVSLSADPVEEVRVGWEILKSLDLRNRGITVISCPTCARSVFDVAAVAMEIERRLADITKPLKVAIMGCVVNGPGEAKIADVGLTGIKEGKASLYIKGKRLHTVPTDEAVELIEEAVRNSIK